MLWEHKYDKYTNNKLENLYIFPQYFQMKPGRELLASQNVEFCLKIAFKKCDASNVMEIQTLYNNLNHTSIKLG